MGADREALLDFSSEMGRELMRNGAEIYRVEESVERLLRAYGCRETEVFAIPSCIIVNIREDGKNYTKAARIKSCANNLRRLEKLNALCRSICRDTPSMEDNRRRMDAVMGEPCYPAWVSYLAHGFVASFFTLFWGGGPLDAVVAFPCGLIVRWVVTAMKGLRANVFFTNLLAGMLCSLPPLLLERMTAGLKPDQIIIGTIMLLVPGIAITNVMRDVLAEDFLTALTRLAEVLIVAVGIAAGVAMAITAVRLLPL